MSRCSHAESTPFYTTLRNDTRSNSGLDCESIRNNYELIQNKHNTKSKLPPRQTVISF